MLDLAPTRLHGGLQLDCTRGQAGLIASLQPSCILGRWNMGVLWPQSPTAPLHVMDSEEVLCIESLLGDRPCGPYFSFSCGTWSFLGRGAVVPQPGLCRKGIGQPPDLGRLQACHVCQTPGCTGGFGVQGSGFRVQAAQAWAAMLARCRARPWLGQSCDCSCMRNRGLGLRSRLCRLPLRPQAKASGAELGLVSGWTSEAGRAGHGCCICRISQRMYTNPRNSTGLGAGSTHMMPGAGGAALGALSWHPCSQPLTVFRF